MKKSIVLLLSIALLSTACKHTKNAEKTTDTTPAQTTYRALVSFGSPGSGIDAQSVAKLESYIISFGKEQGKTLAYDKVKYGKEGEVDYCFPLTELSKNKQAEFVTGLNNLLKGGKIVSIKENAIETHKK